MDATGDASARIVAMARMVDEKKAVIDTMLSSKVSHAELAKAFAELSGAVNALKDECIGTQQQPPPQQRQQPPPQQQQQPTSGVIVPDKQLREVLSRLGKAPADPARNAVAAHQWLLRAKKNAAVRHLTSRDAAISEMLQQAMAEHATSAWALQALSQADSVEELLGAYQRQCGTLTLEAVTNEARTTKESIIDTVDVETLCALVERAAPAQWAVQRVVLLSVLRRWLPALAAGVSHEVAAATTTEHAKAAILAHLAAVWPVEAQLAASTSSTTAPLSATAAAAAAAAATPGAPTCFLCEKSGHTNPVCSERARAVKCNKCGRLRLPAPEPHNYCRQRNAGQFSKKQSRTGRGRAGAAGKPIAGVGAAGAGDDDSSDDAPDTQVPLYPVSSTVSVGGASSVNRNNNSVSLRGRPHVVISFVGGCGSRNSHTTAAAAAATVQTVALVDSGSALTLMSATLCRRLCLPMLPVPASTQFKPALSANQSDSTATTIKPIGIVSNIEVTLTHRRFSNDAVISTGSRRIPRCFVLPDAAWQESAQLILGMDVLAKAWSASLVRLPQSGAYVLIDSTNKRTIADCVAADTVARLECAAVGFVIDVPGVSASECQRFVEWLEKEEAVLLVAATTTSTTTSTPSNAPSPASTTSLRQPSLRSSRDLAVAESVHFSAIDAARLGLAGVQHDDDCEDSAATEEQLVPEPRALTKQQALAEAEKNLKILHDKIDAAAKHPWATAWTPELLKEVYSTYALPLLQPYCRAALTPDPNSTKPPVPALFSIKLIDPYARMPNASYRKYAHDVLSELSRVIPAMLAEGIIERGSGAVANPLVAVRKKNGKIRICTDLRVVNNNTVPQAHAVPNIEPLVTRMGGQNYYYSLDLASFFFQLDCAEESRDLLGFSVPGLGQFRYCRMPFGARNAPAVAQQLIDQVWASVTPDPETPKVAYVDDRNGGAMTPQKFIEAVRSDLIALNQFNRPLLLAVDKIEPLCFELNMLGYVVSREGTRLSEQRVQALLDMRQPQTVQDVQRVLGVAEWMSQFVPNLAQVSAPLRRLTTAPKAAAATTAATVRKNTAAQTAAAATTTAAAPTRRATATAFKHTRVQWSDECEKAFTELKSLVAKRVMLAAANFDGSGELFCFTDASDEAIGAVLCRRTAHTAGAEQLPEQCRGMLPIAFYSKVLTPVQQRWPVAQREAFAVVATLQRFSDWCRSVTTVHVYTDSNTALGCLKSLSQHKQQRLQRWASVLYSFNDVRVHRVEGKHNMIADALSRAARVGLESNVTSPASNTSDISAAAAPPAVAVLSSAPTAVAQQTTQNAAATAPVPAATTAANGVTTRSAPTAVTAAVSAVDRRVSALRERVSTCVSSVPNRVQLQSESTTTTTAAAVSVPSTTTASGITTAVLSSATAQPHNAPPPITTSTTTPTTPTTLTSAATQSLPLSAAAATAAALSPAASVTRTVETLPSPDTAALASTTASVAPQGARKCPTECMFLAALSVQPMDLLAPLRAPALPTTTADWAAAQGADPSLLPIIRYLQNGELPDSATDAAEYGRVLLQSEQLLLGHQDVLWFNAAGQPRGQTRELLPGAVGLLRLVVPESLQDAVLALYHDDPLHGGHRSAAESYSRLSEKFFWVGAHAAMRKYVSECVDCTQLRRSAPVERPKSTPTPMPTRPYEVVYMDYLHVAKSNKGNTELLVIVDSFSGDVELVPAASPTAEAAVDGILLNVLARRLKLPVFINDQGSHFTANEMQLVIKSLNGESRFTSAYNPRCTGKVERMNRVVLKLLRSLVHNLPECWDESQILASVLVNIRGSINRVTGFAPAELVNGYAREFSVDNVLCDLLRFDVPADAPADFKKQHDCRLSTMTDIFEQVRRHVDAERAADYENQPHRALPTYKLNDQVYVYFPHPDTGEVHKLARRFQGPYNVVETNVKGNPDTYIVSHYKNKKDKFTVHSRRFIKSNRPPLVDDKPDEFEISEIVEQVDDETFIVRWKGYHGNHTSSVDIDMLKSSAPLLLAAWARRPRRQGVRRDYAAIARGTA